MKYLLVLFAILWLAAPSAAQDTSLFVRLVDQTARIGDTVFIPAMITSLEDSVIGFTLNFTLSQPGVIEFRSGYTVETAGTLCADWDFIGGSQNGGTNVQISGIAEVDFDTTQGWPSLVPPGTLDDTFLYVVAHVPCVPDPFSDDVQVNPNSPLNNFSDPQGNLITPVSIVGATVVLAPPLLGDIDRSGTFDLVDVVSMVNCAFRNNCPGCGPVLADVNCSGTVDIIDLIKVIEYVFRAGPQLTCP